MAPMSNPLTRLILGLWALATATVCAAAEPPLVYVSIQPQAWFVERLAGDAVRVEVLVGPGDSPATFDPDGDIVDTRATSKSLYGRICSTASSRRVRPVLWRPIFL